MYMVGKRWYSTNQAAAMLDVHPLTIRRWIYAGKLRAEKAAGNADRNHWKIPAEAINELLGTPNISRGLPQSPASVLRQMWLDLEDVLADVEEGIVEEDLEEIDERAAAIQRTVAKIRQRTYSGEGNGLEKLSDILQGR